MSRRRGEFEHRTSIFEGAFRAWSHLGGLDPEDLESKPASDLDPLTNPIDHDTRLSAGKGKKGGSDGGQEGLRNPDGSRRREYPYEPLPRSGLAHPYVQAILSPWLGPDADNEAIQLGLTTLRTWWQHRRKGESGSAVAALGTEKMKGVVEGYTRHFFTLAHCLIMNDREQPPRTLHAKMKELEKQRSKRSKKRAREDEDVKLTALALNGSGMVSIPAAIGGLAGGANDPSQMAAGINADLTDASLSPLERLHAAQRRQLAESGGIQSAMAGVGNPNMDMSALPRIDMKGKCVPGMLDLEGIVDQVQTHATQAMHRGGFQQQPPKPVPSSVFSSTDAVASTQYGDPTTTPVVFVSDKGDIQIAMKVDGITCAHCVKIVETVLKGCNGNKSPIDGLLDAAADRVLCSVLIKIDQAASAKRIAFEAARNLAMVGYSAKAKEMSIVGQGADKKVTMDLGALSTAFEVVANQDSTKTVFDWGIPCTCPDNGIMRDDCQRHSQMDPQIFEAFDARERQVSEYMAGCGSKYGMPCTCGPGCRCANCSEHCKQNRDKQAMQQQQIQQLQAQQQQLAHHGLNNFGAMNNMGGGPQIAAQGMNFNDPLGMGGYGNPNNPLGMNINMGGNSNHNNRSANAEQLGQIDDELARGVEMQMPMRGVRERRSSRNPSIISFGPGVRGLSVSSEMTYGRAMSGLSALSIDWENLEDFDVNVDHSAHINNGGGGTDPIGKEVDTNGSGGGRSFKV